MSDDPTANSPDDLRAEDLPPVEPPSAGFIVQLFVVPALIVMAVVGVWALFGKLASSKQDVQKHVAELDGNEHRRWRAALALAQSLKEDQESDKPDAERLSRDRAVAEKLSAMLDRSLESHSGKDSEIKHQEFLSKTLGLLDVDEFVLPVLQKAMAEEYNREVRKNAIVSVAMIAGRRREAALDINDKSIIDALVKYTQDSDVLFRQLSTFALGLCTGDEVTDQLTVLLNNADSKTRFNAAIGLTRQGSTQGLSVFENVLTLAQKTGKPADPNESLTIDEKERLRMEPYMVNNVFTALADLRKFLEPDQVEKLNGLIARLADDYPSSEIRVAARGLLDQFSAE